MATHRKKKRRIPRDSNGRFKAKVLKKGTLKKGPKRSKRATKADRRLKAEGPGKRRSKTGRVYYERRKNRAD